ncbi:MAG: hypothetical protein HFF36_04105 [Coprobacillus sp.]|nr:hypothetical protein [Coprobacillus sp.]
MLSTNDWKIILIILATIIILLIIMLLLILWIRWCQKSMYKLGLKTRNIISNRMKNYKEGKSNGKDSK